MKKDREDKEKNTSNALFFAVLMYISLTFFSGFFVFFYKRFCRFNQLVKCFGTYLAIRCLVLQSYKGTFCSINDKDEECE